MAVAAGAVLWLAAATLVATGAVFAATAPFAATVVAVFAVAPWLATEALVIPSLLKIYFGTNKQEIGSIIIHSIYVLFDSIHFLLKT
ncbi:MAG: hypothetical protein Q9M22_03090 [Mariprofundaceae bacterium]|nr:hypothetical protein [Mariprofundaceae bacterium]